MTEVGKTDLAEKKRLRTDSGKGFEKKNLGGGIGHWGKLPERHGERLGTKKGGNGTGYRRRGGKWAPEAHKKTPGELTVTRPDRSKMYGQGVGE